MVHIVKQEVLNQQIVPLENTAHMSHLRLKQFKLLSINLQPNKTSTRFAQMVLIALRALQRRLIAPMVTLDQAHSKTLTSNQDAYIVMKVLHLQRVSKPVFHVSLEKYVHLSQLKILLVEDCK